MLPDEGVVASLLGPLSHVAAPLYMRMYLYWNVVLAGSDTVPTIIVYYEQRIRNISKKGLTAPCRIISRAQRDGIDRRPVCKLVDASNDINFLCRGYRQSSDPIVWQWRS